MARALLLLALLLAFAQPDSASLAASDEASASDSMGAPQKGAADTKATVIPQALEGGAEGASKPEKTASDKAEAGVDETDADGQIWSANRNESRITLRGTVPSDEDRQTALGMVKAHFPDLRVEEKLVVTKSDMPREQWLASVSFGLRQLTHMAKGKVRYGDTGLVVTGQASDADEYKALKKALSGTLPTGIVLGAENVRPPVANPFVFQADLGPNALSLAGSVPSEDSRKHVRELSRQLFARPGLDDRLEVASGAPRKWDQAVAAALRALSRLETGKVAVSGIAVNIEGVAPDQGTAVAVSYQLRRDLPEKFSASDNIKWKEAAGTLDQKAESMATKNIAARLIPRIKVTSDTDKRWRSGALPPLMPVGTAQ